MQKDSGYGEMGYTVRSHEKYTPQVPDSQAFNVLAFFIGGVVGAAVALLLAPDEGRETRRKLAGASKEVTDKAESYYHGAREKVSVVVDRGKEFVREGKPAIRAAFDAARDAFNREKERLSGDG